MNLMTLHHMAREIFHEALRSVDAGQAVRRAVQLKDASLKILDTTLDLASHGGGIYAVAIGKAARPMAAALGEILGDHLRAGVIAAPRSTDAFTSNRWRVFEGGHPLPNQASLDAGLAAFELLRGAEKERAPVIFLISGGGSALMEWPLAYETTLEELQTMHRALVACGAKIAEVNAVRRAVSAVKAGGLTLRAPHCNQVTLIVSDTNEGEEAIVASGPTFPPAVNEVDEEALAVVARYDLAATLPASIMRALRRPFKKVDELSEQSLRAHYVLLENTHALESAAQHARARGFTVEIAREVIEQPMAEGCSLLLSRLVELSDRRAAADRSGVCLISGGEFACPVRGRGRGGRNSESSLRWAMELEMRRHGDAFGITHAVALSAGTDGLDGNSPAAGAICDETTIRRSRSLGLNPQRFLDESDAYSFFEALDDTVMTGPTGTNVRDLRIMLAS